MGIVYRIYCIAHLPLVMPYGYIAFHQHWFRQWLVVWWHQAIPWTNIHLSTARILLYSPGDSIAWNYQYQNSDVKWASRHLNSPASRLFVQQFVQADINSLWPNEAIYRHRSKLTLAQVMACCLTAPSHYLKQCWLIFSKVQWHSVEGNLTRDSPPINH